MAKSSAFNIQRFIFNLNLMVKYGWEPEIDIGCKDGKIFGIVAYADGLDIYDENNNLVKNVIDVKELFDIIPAENILSAVDDYGLNYSEDLSARMLIKDGKLYLSLENK
ncbi:MAG TPA: hypothetical protein IAB32_07190 [Candidatus Scatosoma pullicola]|nr:hypothetical protein [Candidatus Scatosoma pullicola]